MLIEIFVELKKLNVVLVGKNLYKFTDVLISYFEWYLQYHSNLNKSKIGC